MRCALIGLALTTAPAALAQNTSGVFGPVVDDGESGWEYRASFDPDDDDLNQRLHYQRAINGALRWRVVAQVRSTDDSDFDPDGVSSRWKVSGTFNDCRLRAENRTKSTTGSGRKSMKKVILKKNADGIVGPQTILTSCIWRVCSRQLNVAYNRYGLNDRTGMYVAASVEDKIVYDVTMTSYGS